MSISPNRALADVGAVKSDFGFHQQERAQAAFAESPEDFEFGSLDVQFDEIEDRLAAARSRTSSRRRVWIVDSLHGKKYVSPAYGPITALLGARSDEPVGSLRAIEGPWSSGPRQGVAQDAVEFRMGGRVIARLEASQRFRMRLEDVKKDRAIEDAPMAGNPLRPPDVCRNHPIAAQDGLHIMGRGLPWSFSRKPTQSVSDKLLHRKHDQHSLRRGIIFLPPRRTESTRLLGGRKTPL